MTPTLTVAAATAGATYQAFAEERDRRRYPAPGRIPQPGQGPSAGPSLRTPHSSGAPGGHRRAFSGWAGK